MMLKWTSRDIFLVAAILMAGASAIAQQSGGSGSSPSSPSTEQPTPPSVSMHEPVLSQHLQVLQQLAQTHNVSTESQK